MLWCLYLCGVWNVLPALLSKLKWICMCTLCTEKNKLQIGMIVTACADYVTEIVNKLNQQPQSRQNVLLAFTIRFSLDMPIRQICCCWVSAMHISLSKAHRLCHRCHISTNFIENPKRILRKIQPNCSLQQFILLQHYISKTYISWRFFVQISLQNNQSKNIIVVLLRW